MTIRKYLLLCVFLSLFIEPEVATIMMILATIGYLSFIGLEVLDR